jgi:hypothetical protein
MGKLLIRLSVMSSSFYLVYCFYMAQFYGVDLLDDVYLLLFELCVIFCCFEQGKFHCKYMRFLAIGVFVSDVLTRLDNYYNFLTITQHNIIPLMIIYSSLLISICSALHHFYKVRKLKRKRL